MRNLLAFTFWGNTFLSKRRVFHTLCKYQNSINYNHYPSYKLNHHNIFRRLNDRCPRCPGVPSTGATCCPSASASRPRWRQCPTRGSGTMLPGITLSSGSMMPKTCPKPDWYATHEGLRVHSQIHTEASC